MSLPARLFSRLRPPYRLCSVYELPSPYLIGGLLLLRLGLQVWRAQMDERLKRPASWALDILLIGLIFYLASNQPLG